MSALVFSGIEFDPLRDCSYRNARLGPDVAAFLAWCELGGMASRTLEDYEAALARVCLMYPKTPIEALTDEQLGQVFRRFPERSRSTRVAPYTTFFKWARLTHRIDSNPMELIPKIKRHKKKQYDLFSDAEIDLLLSLPIIDAAPLALLFEAGLRRREAMETTLRRCSGPDAVKVIQGKGRKDRLAPKTIRLASLLADLELLEGLGPDDHILYGVKANAHGHRRIMRQSPIGEGTFARWWRRCLVEAGVRYRNPHMARHTYGSRMIRRGVPVDDLQMFLGHEDISTTKIYVHSTFEEALGRLRVIEEAELA